MRLYAAAFEARVTDVRASIEQDRAEFQFGRVGEPLGRCPVGSGRTAWVGEMPPFPSNDEALKNCRTLTILTITVSVGCSNAAT